MSSPPLRSRATLPTLFSIIIVDLIGFGVLMPVLPYYADRFGANGFVLGALLATHAAMQFVFAPIWGRLSDRIGRRPVMLGTVGGTAVALVALAFAPSLPWLFAARVASGLFAANISVATAYLTDVTAPDERTRWMGMVGASFGIGFILGPALGAVLAPHGLEVPILAAAGFATVNLVYAAVVLKEPASHQPSQPGGRTRLEVLREPSIGRLTGVNLLFSLAVTQLEAMFAFYMLRRFGYKVEQVAWILVTMALVMALIQGGGMRPLVARFGERALMLTGLALMAIGIGLVPTQHTIAWLMVPLIVSAVGRAIAQPPMMSWASMLAAEAERGLVMGTFQSAASLARVFGPLVAGLLFDRHPAAPFFLASVLLVASVALATAIPSPATAPEVVPRS
jgi:DHA1 family tetracycline resistance protein-like MFS transporter